MESSALVLKLVIFDVDGTLIDSQAMILEAMSLAFARESLPMPSREAALGIVGLSLPEAMRVLVPDADEGAIAKLVESYKAGFLEVRTRDGGEATAPFYPGALAALDRLDAAGFLLSIATGKARRGLDHMLDSHGLRSRFIVTQTADDAPSKPHPGMVLNCLAATGAEAARSVVVGDTEYDMQMASAAGARAVGVAWGYHDAARLRRGGAERIVSNFTELDKVVVRLLEEA